MPQVLEAPELQDEARRPLALDEGHLAVSPQERAIAPADTHRWPITVLHAILSVFTRQRSLSVRACADTPAQYDSALNNICRNDPYLYISSHSG